MNAWIITALIIGALVITGIAIAAVSPMITAKNTEVSCSGCGGKCTSEKNCGLETCGAVNGGTCNCGNK